RILWRGSADARSTGGADAGRLGGCLTAPAGVRSRLVIGMSSAISGAGPAAALRSEVANRKGVSMRTRKPRWLLVVLGVAATVVVAATAGAATVAPLVVASGPSPFATCTAGSGPGAVNYTNAEVEPWVAVNPANPSNIIGAWQQDRWNDGGAHGLVAGFSSDGGTTWGETTLPFSACAPGGLSYERASDPWVSIGPDGTAYTVSISFNASNNNNAVAAATSTNGGKTWRNLRVIQADNAPNFQFFNDK